MGKSETWVQVEKCWKDSQGWSAEALGRVAAIDLPKAVSLLKDHSPVMASSVLGKRVSLDPGVRAELDQAVMNFMDRVNSLGMEESDWRLVLGQLDEMSPGDRKMLKAREAWVRRYQPGITQELDTARAVWESALARADLWGGSEEAVLDLLRAAVRLASADEHFFAARARIPTRWLKVR